MKLSRPKFALALGLLAGLWAGSGCGKSPQTRTAGPAPIGVVAKSGNSALSSLATSRCGFAEPLIATDEPSVQEQQDLLKALESYAARRQQQPDLFKPLESFVQNHPQSPYRGSLYLNLGLLYRQNGYTGRSLDALRQSWQALALVREPQLKALGDRAAGEFAIALCSLGRTEEVEALLEKTRGRKLHGSATELFTGAAEGLVRMKTDPGTSFRCGPLAIAKIAKLKHPEDRIAQRLIDGCKSGPRGTSLAQVFELSNKVHLDYQLAFRSPGSQVIAPAVIHWKTGHFGAVMENLGDKHRVEDATSLKDSLLLTTACLDEESTGYSLVPRGRLPAGWRPVSVTEAAKVWGRGLPPLSNLDSTGPDDQESFPPFPTCGMTTWNAHAMLAGLSLEDIPVGVNKAAFAVPFRVFYAQREANQPAIFTYANLGPKWSCNWLSAVTDNVATAGEARLYTRGGGVEVFRFPPGSNTSNLSPLSTSLLTRSATGEGVRFVREFSDGSQEVFSQALGDRYFMTKVSDAQGNSSTVQFDPQMRITSITDPVGRQMTLSYEMSQDPLKITKVTDPFGRSASFGYTADGHLASVTDVLGITSTYQYGAGDFINTLTTPYGTSHFSYADKTTDPSLGLRRILQITDAAGREFRVEYRPLAPGIPFSEPIAPSGIPTFNIYIYGRNSFAWTPEQLVGGLDYTKATIYHFLHDRVSDTITGRTIESIKKPLENRLWFNYDSTGLAFGHEGPNTVNLPRFVGRVLGDGSTRLYRYLYNSHGNKTRSIDPAGRVTNFSYAPNGIDLISVETGGNTLFQASYDGQHNIVSLSNASGGTSVFTWNSRGQMTSHTNELAETTTYTYTADGNLSSIQAPLDATTQFAYNSAGGLASATDSEGYSVEVIYDAADRPIQLSFPDGTKESLDYRNLDLVSTTDRLGRVNRFEFDAVRRLTQVTDGNGGVATLAYGNFDDPASLQDPGGRQTGFQYDLQGRLSRKQYAGGATQSQSYLPCCGLLGSVTDALGHSKSFSYNLDGTIRNIQYSGSTPPVNFTWDTILPRPLTMTDGQGLSTYTYGAFGAPGANQVTGITGPFGDAASFTYDVAGRPTSQTVNSSAENVTYDALWRPTSTTNALDTFTMSYLGKTGQVTGVTSTTGPSTTYTYAPNAGDRRLSQIKNLGRAGDALSQFDYVYDQVGQITKLTETVGAGNTTGGGGDPCHKKCCHKGKCCKKNKCCKKKCCKGKKDCGRDRCNDRHDNDNDNDDDDDDDRFGMAPPIDPSILNGLIAFSVASLWAGLLWQFARRPRTTTSRLAQVTSAALISALALNGCIFSGGGGTTGNTNVYDFTYDRLGQLVGVDLNQTAQERYQFDPSGNLTSLTVGNTTTSFAANNLNQQTTPGTHVYDAKGQKTTLDGKTFEWDDQGRVTAIVQGTTRSEFAYDGMSRRTKITELTNGTVTSKKLYWWLGGTIVCERDGLVSGFPITKRYFGQGLVQGVTKLFYTFDHLGSVRELVDDAGTVQALYRYSTYGERTKETGNLDSDWGYAGLWHHGPSGLDLATYRLYDAKNRRWISRDPLGEGVDYNLYRYCGNNPVGCIDPNGLRPLYPFPNVMQNAYHAARSVIDAEHPYWRTEVGLANDAYWTPAENEAGKPLAGNTGQGAGDDTSYINFARLSRIQDNDSRFFEVLHTLAHELWHQNNPTPRKDLFGSDFIEDEADAYADHVVETYVLKQCNPHRKRKYRLWKSKRKKVRDQAGRDTLKW